MEIVEQGVREDDDWWYVPVHPSSQGAITYHYYGVLTDIEGELKANDHLDVLLVPSAGRVAKEEHDMAIAERKVRSLLADKGELRRLMAEQNEKMGFVRLPGATAQQARDMMLAAGIRPEDNGASRELMHVRYGDDSREE